MDRLHTLTKRQAQIFFYYHVRGMNHVQVQTRVNLRGGAYFKEVNEIKRKLGDQLEASKKLINERDLMDWEQIPESQTEKQEPPLKFNIPPVKIPPMDRNTVRQIAQLALVVVVVVFGIWIFTRESPQTPATEASVTPEETPEETVGVTPSGPVVLWETHFEDDELPDDWDPETTNVQPGIQDGFFVSPKEFRFTVGDGTWKDVSVTIDFEDSPCWAGIGLRNEFAVSVCNDYIAKVWSNDLNDHLPDADFKWPGVGKLTFSVRGDRYDYHGKYIIRPGNPTGLVWIKIPGGTKVRKITVTQLP